MFPASCAADSKAEIVRTKWVCDCLQITDRGLRKWVAEGKFPPPLRLNGRPVWRKVDVIAYLSNLTAEGRADAK